jgi:protein phosphatase
MDSDNTPTLHLEAPRATRIPSERVEVALSGLSHRGLVRSRNEDYFLAARFGRSLQTVLTNLPEDCVPPESQEIGYGMVVADGMGGMAAGDVASRSAIQTLVQLVLNTPDWILSSDQPWLSTVMDRMAERFRQVDERLVQQAQDQPAYRGMGTTLTLACTLGLDAIVCHIGDTRAYLFRDGELRQLTRDMTMAQELIDAGLVDPFAAAAERCRHVLTQAMGSGRVSADVQHIHLEDGDRMLLCSDGLTSMVNYGQILDALRAGDAPEQTCQKLLDQALAAGGKDNITMVLADFRLK